MLVTKSAMLAYLPEKFIKSLCLIGKIDKKEIITFIPCKSCPTPLMIPGMEMGLNVFCDRVVGINAYDVYGKEIQFGRFKFSKWKRKPHIVVVKLLIKNNTNITAIWNVSTAGIAMSINNALINTFKSMNAIASLQLPIPHIMDVLKGLYGDGWKCINVNEVDINSNELIQSSSLVLKAGNYAIVAENISVVKEISTLVLNTSK